MCHEVQNNWIRKTVLIVRLSTSCRNVCRQNVRQLLTVPVDAGCVGDDQLFPVLPLEGLDQVPERRACCWILPVTLTVLLITILMVRYCHDNANAGVRSRESADARFFMVGAYQEILGNMHNLFGEPKRLTCSCSLTVA